MISHPGVNLIEFHSKELELLELKNSMLNYHRREN